VGAAGVDRQAHRLRLSLPALYIIFLVLRAYAIRGAGADEALRMPDGTVEALKWLALALMTGDHVNKYLFNATLPVLFEAGRVALPLSCSSWPTTWPGLAHSSAACTAAPCRAWRSLALASVPFVALGGLYAGWWPLNVMFTLLVVTACAYERGGKLHRRPPAWCSWSAAARSNIVAGRGLRPGRVVVRAAQWAAAAVAVLACAALWFINRNLWALAALPVLFLASRVDLRVPRLRWAFYAYYPLHLAALWLIRIPMSKAGYLFF
jgi:hypothetical protein